MASLISLGLLALLTNLPLSAAAPAKRQFRPGGYGRPDHQVGPPVFGPPRFGPPDSDSSLSLDTIPAVSSAAISAAPDPVAAAAQPADPSITTINTPAGQATDPTTLSTVSIFDSPAATIPPPPTISSNTVILTSIAPLTASADPSTGTATATATGSSPAQFFASTQTPGVPNATVFTASDDPASNTEPSSFSDPTNTNTNTNTNTLPAAASNTVSTPSPASSPSSLPLPNSPSNITITPDNTLNGTVPGNAPPSSLPQSTPGLNVELVNNFGTSSVNIYVTARDETGRVMLLTPAQTWFYPTASSSDVPQAIDQELAIPMGAVGSTLRLNLPGYFESGRIYFAAGTLNFYTLLNPQGVTLVAPDPMNPTDPASRVTWSFVEMTYSSIAGLFANLSFVDFLGLPVGMSLLSPSGSTLNTVAGTEPGALAAVCGALTQKAAVEGQPWDKLCEYGGNGGALLRVDSPGKYIAARDSAAFATYWDAYVGEVWARYAAEPLYIDAQNDLGVLTCSTASGLLTCPGASRPLPAPLSTTDSHSALDIFACSGIFSTQSTDNAVDLAVLPRVCAALNRSTFLLGPPGSDSSTTSAAAAPASPSSGSLSSTTNTNTSTDVTSNDNTPADAGDAGTAGNYQPGPAPSRYYAAGGPPTNWYAWAVHAAERDGKGYAFAYDDVYPSASSASASSSDSTSTTTSDGSAGNGSGDTGKQVDVSGSVSAAGEEVGVWRVFVGGMAS